MIDDIRRIWNRINREVTRNWFIRQRTPQITQVVCPPVSEISAPLQVGGRCYTDCSKTEWKDGDLR